MARVSMHRKRFDYFVREGPVQGEDASKGGLGGLRSEAMQDRAVTSTWLCFAADQRCDCGVVVIFVSKYYDAVICRERMGFRAPRFGSDGLNSRFISAIIAKKIKGGAF